MTTRPPTNYAPARKSVAATLNRRTDKALSILLAIVFLILWLVFGHPEVGFWIAGFAATAKAVANRTIWSGDDS